MYILRWSLAHIEPARRADKAVLYYCAGVICRAVLVRIIKLQQTVEPVRSFIVWPTLVIFYILIMPHAQFPN